jgi:predicted CXXCH cytochrome family protein
MKKQKIIFEFLDMKSNISFITMAAAAILILGSSLNFRANAQTATATWALTANSASVVAGNITASTIIFGAGLTVPGSPYTAANGATCSHFDGAVCNPNATDYFEFNVTALCGNNLNISSITFDHRTSSPTRCYQFKYAINNGTDIQIGSDISVASSTATPYSTGAISISVPQGQTIRFRLYGATGNTSRSLSVRNFVVNGTTTSVSSPLPSVSITSNPSGAICPGSLVTFTAFPLNGGTGPSYQWYINSTPAGTNSSTFSSSGLAANDQVSCQLTSNLMCATPSTATSNSITTVYLPTTIATPGPITGPTSVALSSTGLVYSISAVSGATNYVWTVPPTWVISSGNGSTSILVNAGSLGNNGNITVAAANACVTGAVSSLAVELIPPHNSCNQCHITHTSPGMSLTSLNGNANLCMSCHVTNGAASSFPFSNAMKANPGVSGSSHAWDAAAVNSLHETNMPSNSDMAARTPGGNIICSTCHNQHNPLVELHYLRSSNSGDAMCKDCHSARNKGTYASNQGSNKGTHPVGVNFNAGDSRFLSTPNAPFSYENGKVECSSCHQTHYAPSNDGNLVKATNNNTVCTSCHIEKNATITLEHEGMTCKTCHYTHNPDKSNILMVRNSIQTPNSGLKTVVFTANSSPNNYGDASGTFDGVCEVCHTNTDHYTNTSGGTSDPRHNPSNQSCITCHTHSKGFYASTNCLDCHNVIADKPGVGPVGGRRQIVDNLGNGSGTGGDFKRYSHHVTSTVPTNDDCLKCHYMGDHMNGTVKLMDPDLGYMNIFTYDPLNKAGVEGFCLKCHDSNGAFGSTTPFSDGVTVPVVDATMWANSSHKSSQTCLTCHDNGHGSNKSAMIGPFNYTGPGTGTDLMNEEEGFCLSCHGSGGAALAKVHLAFSTYTNTTTNFYKHDAGATYRVHNTGETLGTAFGGANRHAECVDCHNPHGAKAGTATAPAILPTMIGATGVEPTYAGAGAPTGFTWQPNVTAEYQVCYKCHSSYTTLPTYLPDGWSGTAIVADGLKKITTAGVNSQVADSRDMAAEYNPNNNSYHPVMAVGKNPNINVATFQTGWNSNSRMYCSSCHNNPLYATSGQGRGPHGSQNMHILDQRTTGAAVNFKTSHSGTLASSSDVCGKCHQDLSYWANNQNSRFPYHDTHMDGEQAECYLCHDSHGSEQFHNLNFNRNVPNCLTAFSSGNSQTAFSHDLGTARNACLITCHGTTHSSTSRSYFPAYQ